MGVLFPQQMKRIIFLLAILPYMSIAQSKSHKVEYQADLGLNIGDVRGNFFLPVAPHAALKLKVPSWGLTFRIRGEYWVRTNTAAEDYVRDVMGFQGGYTPKHYQVFAAEVYKTFQFGNEKTKSLYCGLGVTSMYPYYLYRGKIDTIWVAPPDDYILHFSTNQSQRNFMTCFVGFPVHWFYVEGRFQFPISKARKHPSIAETLIGTPTPIFHLTLYYTFPRNYYLNKK